jgi:hypothetical protein
MNYNEQLNEYQLSNKDKLMESNFPGNFVGLNTKTCAVRGEGKITLGSDKLGQVNFTNYGEVKQNPKNDSIIIQGALATDFFIDEKMWTNILNNVLGNPKLEPVDNTRPIYGKAIREMAGKELGDKLVAQLNLYGAFKKVPKEVRHNIMFSDVKMYWDKYTKSYKSSGLLGIGVMDKKQVNKYVKGHIQLTRKKGTEKLSIYLELEEELWYFFEYSNGVMRCVSSQPEFNAMITDLKADKREMKPENKAQGPYSFMLGTERTKRKFVSAMKN